MKTKFITHSVLGLTCIATLLFSCRSSRKVVVVKKEPKVVVVERKLPPGQAKKIYGSKSAKVYAPGQQKKMKYKKRYPLIIIRTPDIVIHRFSDGRYYYRNSEGFYYWKGDDDRFYLDQQHLDNVEYDHNEYDDWNSKGKIKYNSNGNGKGNGKSKKKN